MQVNSRSRNRMGRLLLVLAGLGVSLAPAHATVSTVYSCPSSGHNGNHDGVYNGFFVQNVNATNLHSVQLYYTTDTNGVYNVTLEVHRGSFAGPLVGTLSQNMSLSDSSDTAVTWTFPDPAIPNGSDLYFIHTYSGSGSVNFNMQPTLCPGDRETVGTSSTINNFSVAVAITQNTTPPPPACVANSTTLCIDNQPGDRRFQVRATFATSQAGGVSGSGRAVQLSTLGVTEGGLFWFFDAKNPEMLIKVLNACGVNNRFWVFYAATTNVGFHVTVTDMATGHSADYTNPDIHTAPPVQDLNALTCP